jgi:hypothetical protein
VRAPAAERIVVADPDEDELPVVALIAAVRPEAALKSAALRK